MSYWSRGAWLHNANEILNFCALMFPTMLMYYIASILSFFLINELNTRGNLVEGLSCYSGRDGVYNKTVCEKHLKVCYVTHCRTATGDLDIRGCDMDGNGCRSVLKLCIRKNKKKNCHVCQDDLCNSVENFTRISSMSSSPISLLFFSMLLLLFLVFF
ncbi:hypothetical protein DICVIV_08292, partial [Dictyocaulus viviparus]